MNIGTRPRWRSGAWCGAVLAALLVVLTAAAPAATATATRASLVGSWAAEVQTSIPSSGTATLIFEPDGDLVQIAADGTRGNGQWRRASHGLFFFDISHPRKDPDGTIIGEVRGAQITKVNLAGDMLVSSGVSTAYDLADAEVRTFTVTISASRLAVDG